MVSKFKFEDVSPAFSMAGWDLLTYLKKRKKTIVTTVAAVLLYVITKEEVASIVAAAGVEMLFALGEYYLSEVDNS